MSISAQFISSSPSSFQVQGRPMRSALVQGQVKKKTVTANLDRSLLGGNDHRNPGLLNSAFLSRWYFPFSKGGDVWKLHMFFPQPWRFSRRLFVHGSQLWLKEVVVTSGGFSYGAPFRCCWPLVSMYCWNTFAASRRVLRFQSFNDVLKCLFLRKSLGGWGDERNSSFQRFLPWRWTLIHYQSNEGKTYIQIHSWPWMVDKLLDTNKVTNDLISRGELIFSLASNDFSSELKWPWKTRNVFCWENTRLQCQAYIIQRGVFLRVFVTKIRWHAEAWSTRSPGPRW